MPEYQLVRSPLHPALPEELVVLAACFAAGSQAYSWLTALYHVLSYVDEKYQAAEKEAERVKLLFQEAARAAEALADATQELQFAFSRFRNARELADAGLTGRR